jgi:hypothetical protein
LLPAGTGGPVRQPWRPVVALSLLDALLRALDGQRRQTEAPGVRIALTVPDTPRLRDAAPGPLPRALPALVRAALAAMPPGEALEVEIDIATSDVVQVSMAGPLRPGAAFAPPPGGGLGGLDLPAPARRSVAMIARRGGRVEDRSSAAVGRLRLVIRVPYDRDGAVAAHPPGAGATGGAPARPGGRPRR